jgi:4-amino-4-deoxy-L-arabinose transferase-like glycosyltransferase
LPPFYRRKSLWLVLGFALAVRLAVFAVVDRSEGFFHRPDSDEYDRLARNLIDHRTYSLAEAPPWTPDLTRTPVFPLFVTGCYLLGEPRPVPAIVAQVVCAVATCGFVHVMGERLLGPMAATVCAALLAVDPLSIRYATLLLSETLFTLLFTASLWCLLLYQDRPHWGRLAAAALLTGAALLCRPIAVLWPAALLPWFALLAWRRASWRPLGHYLLLAGVSVALAGAWILRNDRAGGVTVLTTVQGINLYYHRAARVVAKQENISVTAARARLKERLREAVESEHLTPLQEYRRMEQWGAEIVGSHPGTYFSAHTAGVARLFLPHKETLVPGLSEVASARLEGGYLLLLYGLAVVGLPVACAGSARIGFALLGGVILYFAVLSGPEAYPRFRVPLMPVLALLAGAGFTTLPWLRRRQPA